MPGVVNFPSSWAERHYSGYIPVSELPTNEPDPAIAGHDVVSGILIRSPGIALPGATVQLPGPSRPADMWRLETAGFQMVAIVGDLDAASMSAMALHPMMAT